MEVLPEVQMEMLDFIWTPNRPLEGTVARTTIPQHSRSIRMIKIVYQITIASPWASSKMTRLCLSVSVTLPSSSLPADIQYVPSYLKTPPVPLAEDEGHIFTQLEVFYRQIGKQTNMQYLRLHRPVVYRPGDIQRIGEMALLPGL
ncbi:hypothetical protein BGZ88_012365 [Linnemannia elongata]|nr:hypothetical protein BGZ88_012365 [Linnemannia elongata]